MFAESIVEENDSFQRNVFRKDTDISVYEGQDNSVSVETEGPLLFENDSREFS